MSPQVKKAIRRRPAAVDRDVRATTADEFLQILSPLASAWSDTARDWIFRGVGDAERHKLIPSALREPPPGSPPLILKYTTKTPIRPRMHKEQIEAEYDLLWDFFRVADGQGLLIPEDSQIYRSPWASEPIHTGVEEAKNGRGPWPFDELISLAALAQHHGVPTRLMDWSNDAFTAAYFAAAGGAYRIEQGDPDDECLAVWCLNWRYIWLRWPGGAPDDIEVLLVMAPRATNPNLHAQGGVFTVRIVKPGKPNAPIDRQPLDVAIETTSRNQGLPFPILRRVTLPIRESGRLLRLLAGHNIHAASIYPGFDGVVKHLHEWRPWDVPPPERDLPIR
jgi:hypothetical protein